MSCNLRFICLFLGYLAVSATPKQPAFASDELRITITSMKPVKGVHLSLPGQQVADCRSEKKPGASDAYLCTIPEFDTTISIESYNVMIEGDEIDVQPIKIRVNSTMKMPLSIGISLADGKLFQVSSELPSGYYQTWRNKDTKPTNDFGSFLITRNLYEKIDPQINEVRAYVLKRWVERAAATAEGLPWQGNYFREITDEQQRLAGNANNEQKKVLTQYAPAPADLKRLRYADWSVFKQEGKVTELNGRQANFCRLYKAFKQMWEDAKKEDKDDISQIWAVNDTNMNNPAKAYPAFANCAVDQQEKPKAPG